MKAADLICKGVKCDAVGCDYRDDTAKREDYEKLLNAPCPKCGAPLLTEKDMAVILMLEAAVAVANSEIGDIEATGEKVEIQRYHFDGSGFDGFTVEDLC